MLENIYPRINMKTLIIIYMLVGFTLITGITYMNKALNTDVARNKAYIFTLEHSGGPVSGSSAVIAVFSGLSVDSASDALQTVSGINVYHDAMVELQ